MYQSSQSFPQGPRLQINTGNHDYSDATFSVELTTPSPTRAQFSASGIPAVHVPHESERSPLSPAYPALSGAAPHSSRALNESRKLLGHLLDQLTQRQLPPAVFESFKDVNANLNDKGIADVVHTVRAAVKFKGGKKDGRVQPIASQGDNSDEEDEVEKTFTTDATFALMAQLKEVLLISKLQNWQIFYDDNAPSNAAEDRHASLGRSPFRRRRSSLQVSGGKRSRSPSPARGGRVQAPQLLSQCISVLASVVLEDCRFKISSPRPSRPPNALQAAVLDVAQFLIHIQRHDSKVISQIGFALIPAFSTFHVEMQPRLLAFFEEGIIRGVLDDLNNSQGINSPQNRKDQIANMEIAKAPVSIHIEEPTDDGDAVSRAAPPWTPWSSLALSSTVNVQSTTAPRRPLSVYYLASLVPPLLVSILESVDLTSPHAPTLHRFCQLVDLIATSKPDSYLDILEVVAYHTNKARRSALCVLSTFWPNALGHVTVSKPLPIFSYLDSLQRSGGSGPMLRSRADHPYAHQFVPWRFMSPSKPAIFEGALQQACRSCSMAIHGFGLLCPFCMCAVHFDCYDYPEGSFLSQYSMASDSSTQKVAVHRFCHVLSPRRDWDSQFVKKERHAFRLVNIFTLSLCFICRTPLWGCITQGLKCTSCQQFVHSTCLSRATAIDLPRCRSVTIDSSHMSIDSETLRRTFSDHFREILAVEDLKNRTYEEISVISAVLWTQLQLLNNGVALGSVVITKRPNFHNPTKRDPAEWELHYVLQSCERYLSSGRLPISVAIDEYLQESHRTAAEHYMLFDWSNLAYISTIIKSSFEESKPVFASHDLLNVNQLQGSALDDTDDTLRHPYEVVSLPHMRDALGYELHLFSDTTAGYLLSHLHHLGFFNRQDFHPILFEDRISNNDIPCVFAIPLGLDLSTDVETLFAAIEGCLSDLDLSVNEQGFLLLVRRLWPNGMASEYALQRLVRNIISWIFAEDANLAAILRDYLAQGRQLPGVRTGLESIPWPSASNTRSVSASAVNNGGDYVASRRALLNQYGARWLLALHDEDVNVYANMIYEICTNLAEDLSIDDTLLLGAHDADYDKKKKISHVDSILRCITKLCQTAVTFSVFDDLFLMWLETVSAMGLCHEPIPSLYRLFNREAESAGRFSTLVDASLGPVDAVGQAVTESWRVVMQVASTSKESWIRSLQWLCVFARSGVDIPVPIYITFSSLANKFDASLLECGLLVEAVLSSTWLKSMGRQELQTIFSTLHARLASQVLDHLKAKIHLPDTLTFIRRSLATCLILYGCERSVLVDLEMILQSEIQDLPSRRKINTRVSMATDPVIMNAGLMNALDRYVQAQVDDVSCYIAKFLNTFVTDSSLLEPYEVDNFILRNGRVLCACAWDFYNIQRHELSGIRISFLLRILVVDSQPFQSLLNDLFLPENSSDNRFLAIIRLHRIILDVTSPSFHVEDRQWRSCVTDVFHHYFNALWADGKEEIRIAVDTWSQSLLPAHFEAISLCWNELLSKAPIAERVKLVSFLVQLHPHFPTWRVLSWDAIIEALLEDDYLQKHGGNDDGAAAAHLSMYGLSSKDEEISHAVADPDMATLRVSILLLSLQMLVDGVNIDTFSLLKVKFHLAQVIGFEDVSVVPASSGHAFHVRLGDLGGLSEHSLPCVNQLSTVLDASHSFDIAPSAMGGRYVDDDTHFSLLVGAIIVDLTLFIVIQTADLSDLPILTTKSLLESLMIIIYKHDLDIKPLKHLHVSLMKSVRRVMELVPHDGSYEVRQLALSVVQAYVKRWPTLQGPFIFDAVENAARLIIKLEHNVEDVLVAQARSFLETTFSAFSANGIFGILCKRPLNHDFFVVLKHITDLNAKSTASRATGSLRDALLREAISNIADNDSKICQIMLNNIHAYIEVAHHQGYSADLMQAVGISLISVARKSSDWPISFDPSSMLLISSILLQHNKAQSRELLSYVETVIRVALTRFNVGTKCLGRILHVTSTLYRKTQPRTGPPGSQTPQNAIALAIFEILADGLRKEGRVTPITISSIIEAITTSDTEGYATPAQISPEAFYSSAEDGFFFLQNHSWSEVQSENDFAASVAVAKMILQAAEQKPDVILKQMTDSVEKSSRPGLSIRTWNILAFAALSSTSERWTTILFAHFSTFSFAYNLSLRGFVNIGANPPETAQADINHAYSGIKLWLMLALKKFRLKGVSPAREKDPAVLEDNEDAATRMVWNELWPPFALLVDFFDPDIRVPDTASLAPLAWSSVADLFLFVRQSRSAAAHEASSHIALLTRLQRWSVGDSATNSRLSRALRSMSEPPGDVSMEVLASQIAKSIVAEEKLVVLEAKRREVLLGKAPQERNRRDARLPT